MFAFALIGNIPSLVPTINSPSISTLIDNPAPLSSDALDNRPLLEPLSLLDWKWDTTTSPPTKLVLVQWLGLAPEGTTWESWDKHLHCFSP